MSVDDEAHGLVGDAFQRYLNLFGQGGVLVVDDHDAIIANGCTNVSASTFQHIDVAGHSRDLHLYFADVLVLSGDQAAGKHSGDKKNPDLAHDSPRLQFDHGQTF